MKALEILKSYQNEIQTSVPSNIDIDEAIEELEKLENKSCDGCKYDEKDDTYPSICWECSRYYADKFELKGKQ